MLTCLAFHRVMVEQAKVKLKGLSPVQYRIENRLIIRPTFWGQIISVLFLFLYQM
jgi:hypothetical protein